ncbi:hypothetical protein D3C78_1835330 [compost metagenome]
MSRVGAAPAFEQMTFLMLLRKPLWAFDHTVWGMLGRAALVQRSTRVSEGGSTRSVCSHSIDRDEARSSIRFTRACKG